MHFISTPGAFSLILFRLPPSPTDARTGEPIGMAEMARSAQVKYTQTRGQTHLSHEELFHARTATTRTRKGTYVRSGLPLSMYSQDLEDGRVTRTNIVFVDCEYVLLAVAGAGRRPFRPSSRRTKGTKTAKTHHAMIAACTT